MASGLGRMGEVGAVRADRRGSFVGRRLSQNRTPRARRGPLTTAVVVLAVLALVTTLLQAEPVEAGVYNPVPAGSDGLPNDWFEADDALFAFATVDTKGGQICVVSDEDPVADRPCDEPAWGTPNTVVGIGTTYTLLEAPYLLMGTWRLATTGADGGLLRVSEVFTVAPCSGPCDATIGQDAADEFKAAAVEARRGAAVTCLAFELHEEYAPLVDDLRKIKKAAKPGPRNAGPFTRSKPVSMGVDTSVSGPVLGDLAKRGIEAAKEKLDIQSVPTGLSNPAVDMAKDILKELSCQTRQMYDDIIADPPDFDFGVVATPVFAEFPDLVEPARSHAVALDRLAAYGAATLEAYEKYQGAELSGSVHGVTRQAQSVADLALEMATSTRRAADALRSRADDLDATPGFEFAVLDLEDQVIWGAVFERVQTDGFLPAEIDALGDLGLAVAEIDALEDSFADGRPQDLPVGATVPDVLRTWAHDLDESVAGIDRFARTAAVVAAENDVPPDITIEAERLTPETFRFEATAISYEGQSLGEVQWDFGDGTTAEGDEVEHTYAADGTYQVRATVAEPRLVGEASIEVLVADNLPPVAVDDELTLVAGSTGSILPTGNDTEPDGESLTIVEVFDVSGADVTCGEQQCDVAAGWVPGTFGFSYRVADPLGADDVGRVTLQITPAPNLPPVAVDDVVTVVSGGTATVDVSANDSDPDGDPLTYGLQEMGPGLVAASCTLSGSCEVTAANVVGATWVKVGVSDGVTPSQVSLLTIQIDGPGNRAPVASSFAVALPADSIALLTLGGSDPDGDDLTHEVVAQPTHGTLTGTPPNLTYDPDAGYVGQDEFTYRVSDGQRTSATATVTLTMLAGNLAPIVDAGPDQTIDEGGYAVFAPVVEDPDGTVAHVFFDYGDGTGDTSGSHTFGDDGVYTVVVLATDDEGATSSDTLTVTVENVTPTVAITAPVVGVPGFTNRVGLTVSDPVDPVVTTVDFGDGTVTTTLDPIVEHRYAEPGTYTITATASDGDGGTGQDTHQIVVAVPAIDAGPDRTVAEGDVVSYMTTATPAGIADLGQTTWIWGDGSSTGFGGVSSADHAYGADGTYVLTVRLTVFDLVTGDQVDATDTATITVANVAPEVAAFAPPYARPGEAVDLVAGFTDPGAPHDDPTRPPGIETHGIVWSLGDGRAAFGPTPRVSWAAAGTYAVTATVTDSDGGTTTVAAGTVEVGTPPAFTADTAGTTFSIAFPPNSPENGHLLTLYISGEDATEGRVVLPGLAFDEAFSVVPGVTTAVSVPLDADRLAVDAQVDSIRPLAVLIRARDEVTVYGLNRAEYTTDAFLALPDDVLGTTSTVLGYNDATFGGGTGFSQVAVVATRHDTVVQVTPSPSLAAWTGSSEPASHTLDKGEVLLVRSPGGGGTLDITGTRIEASDPVSVLGGAMCVFVPDPYLACDHLVEQQMPDAAWGRDFATVPLALRTGGDVVRVLAAEPATEVRIDGVLVGTLDAGEHHEATLTGPARIQTSRAALVAQYSTSIAFSNDAVGDPFMMLVPPTVQFLDRYTVATPDVGIAENFLNLIAPAGFEGTIRLDGDPVAAHLWQPVPGGALVGAQVPVAVGSHRLEGDRAFGVSVYGFDFADSYGYPGGHQVARIDRVSQLALEPLTGGARVGSETCVDARARDADGAIVRGVGVTFAVTGANPAGGFAAGDADGRARFCWTGTTTGADVVTASFADLSATAGRTWRAAGTNAAPTGASQTISTLEDVAVPVTLAAVDADDDPMTITIVGGPADGELTGSVTNRTYTPNVDWSGVDSFTYRVSDGASLSPVYTITLVVTPVDDPPTGVLDFYAAVAGQPLEVAAPGVLANDLVPDEGAVAATLVAGPQHGSLQLAADGGFSYTADDGFSGVDTFTYRPDQGVLEGSAATVYLAVTAVNRAPLAVDDEYTVDENTTLDVPAPGILANDTDPDGDLLTLALVGVEPDEEPPGDLVLRRDGGLTYTPPADFVGTVTFDYVVNDGRATSEPATVAITVEDDTTSTTSTTTTSTSTTSTSTTSTSTTSTTSTTTTTVPAGVPGAPLDVSAIGGDANARVRWQPPASDGGSPILGYSVEALPGGAVTETGNVLTTVVEGLTNGQEYSFGVRARNAVGYGPPSTVSNIVLPRGDCDTDAFADVGANHPFCPEITWMADEGIARGYPDGNYRPATAVSRQAMTAFLYRLAGAGLGPNPTCSTTPFPDVPVTNAFCGTIQWAVEEQIARGFNDGRFRPGDPVSRQGMAAFLYRFAGSPRGDDPSCDRDQFVDVTTSHPFCGEIDWMIDAGVAGGFPDGTFRGGDAISRQSMAAFIFRFELYLSTTAG